ncbi:NB-ARC domain-containing protein [Streptomyces griseosporeus]|uniref:NB-ARC domain-containing protein n=1 Tax=Streptomyces griseosporeus TaxID=1910 RepID=UPI0036F65C71
MGPAPPVALPDRDAEARRLAAWVWRELDDGDPAAAAPVLVLHGPGGIGKTALAAAVAGHVPPDAGPAHWLSVADSRDLETVLLRLLAEAGAPRRPVLEAALSERGVFLDALAREVVTRVTSRVLVLDGLRPALGRRLLPYLARLRAPVLVTSRSATGWPAAARRHAVGPLTDGDALRLVRQVALAHGRTGPGTTDRHREAVAAAQGSPALLRVAGALPAGPSPTGMPGPHALVGHAVGLLGDAEQEVLGMLAARPAGAFTAETVAALPVPRAVRNGAQDIVDRLASRELAQPLRDGVLVVPGPVADLVLRRMPAYPRRVLRGRMATAALDAAVRTAAGTANMLDGTAPPDGSPRARRRTAGQLASRVDEFMALLERTPPGSPQARTLADALASALLVLGDSHRLVALHRTADGAVRASMSAAALDLGLPSAALDLLAEPHRPAEALALATALHHTGRLREALSVLDSTPELHGHAWESTLTHAVRCDQGYPAVTELALREAGALHSAAGCRRGRGLVLWLRARACLLLGRPEDAKRFLRAAEQELRTVGDVRAVNRVTTDRVRLHLLRGDIRKALSTAQRALAAHEVAEDRRGMGWTCHHLGLVHAADGRPADARVALLSALDSFEQCEDGLGVAWTRHRLALLAPDADRARSELQLAAVEFQVAGCPHGQAWSLLEWAVRGTDDSSADECLNTADALFRRLNDRGGALWVANVRAHRTGTGADASAPPLPMDHLGDAEGWEYALTDHEAFWSQPPESRRIPFLARDIVAAPLPHPDARPARPAVPRCTVRVTLLDEAPASRAGIHLLLRVEPEDGHPWAASAAAPWLTAVATPLTRATVEPATALLRPSSRAAHGAEFAFTAHRPGLHRLRFTVALERTGAVLQQVETELDILDNDPRPGRTAPHAASLWGRW